VDESDPYKRFIRRGACDYWSQPMEYLRNAWYVAAWSEELTAGKLIARTFLDEPLVLFRTNDGAPAALFDRCPHRFAPLSRGRHKGTEIECGYHGLRFDRSGACSLNPYNPGHSPPRARVQSYPVLERQGIVWIWMGDPDKVDTSLAPDFPILGDATRWHTIRGYVHTPANYQLSIDNLLDLTHPEFLHDSSLGSPAHKTASYEVKQPGPREVHSNRWYDEGPIPPVMEYSFPTGGRPVMHWAEMAWYAPSALWLDVGVTFPGHPRAEGLQTYAGHLVTPETARTTHYFFSFTRTAALARAENNDAQLLEMLRRIFTEEDSAMLAAVQERMGGQDLWALKPAALPGDAGAVRVRQALEKLIAEERASR
jgi:vanillate O-demethylase monooxygenase subunit